MIKKRNENLIVFSASFQVRLSKYDILIEINVKKKKRCINYNTKIRK